MGDFSLIFFFVNHPVGSRFSKTRVFGRLFGSDSHIRDILIIFQKNQFLVIFFKKSLKFCYTLHEKKSRN